MPNLDKNSKINLTKSSVRVVSRKEHSYLAFFFKTAMYLIVGVSAYLSSQQMHYFDILTSVCPHKMDLDVCVNFAKSDHFTLTRNVLIAHKLAMLIVMLATVCNLFRMLFASIPMFAYVKIIDAKAAWMKPISTAFRLNGRMKDVNKGMGFKLILTSIAVMIVCCVFLALFCDYHQYYEALSKIISPTK